MTLTVQWCQNVKLFLHILFILKANLLNHLQLNLGDSKNSQCLFAPSLNLIHHNSLPVQLDHIIIIYAITMASMVKRHLIVVKRNVTKYNKIKITPNFIQIISLKTSLFIYLVLLLIVPIYHIIGSWTLALVNIWLRPNPQFVIIKIYQVLEQYF
jgi:hypothetical protein